MVRHGCPSSAGEQWYFCTFPCIPAMEVELSIETTPGGLVLAALDDADLLEGVTDRMVSA